MPDIDGFEVFEMPQNIKETKNIPIIAFSANAMENNIKKAEGMGFFAYITKPVNIPIFLEKIDSYLKTL